MNRTAKKSPGARMEILAAGLLACVAVGCAQKRPVLYPNYALRSAGTEQVQADVGECMELAKYHVDPESQASKAAKRTAAGAATGAAAGAAGGAVVGRAGTGAGVGAASWGARSIMGSLFRSRDPDPIVRSYVEVCLRERGYQTIGWR